MLQTPGKTPAKETLEVVIGYDDHHDNCNDDHDHDDDNVHLVNDWFEQDIELGVVGQGCIVVVGKVCWFPARQ